MLDRICSRLGFPGHAASGRSASLLVWSEDTAGRSYDTGVQRVVRSLLQGLLRLGVEAVPVGWDLQRRTLRTLTYGEHARLKIAPPGDASRDGWANWLLVPEIPIGVLVGGVDPVRIGHVHGLRVAAIVHDLIPIKCAELYEPATVAFYRTYYRMLADADLIIATTRYVADDLRRYLDRQGLRVPAIVICPLAAELPGIARRNEKAPLETGPFKLITVSRREPRKNLPRLLRALGPARKRVSRQIHLTVLGRRGGFPAYDAEVDALLAHLPNVEVCSSTDDKTLVELFARSHASVYPSWEEGFGLPVLESLWLATPCLCHEASAMAEVAPGGGTFMIDMTNEHAIADALCRMATDARWLRQLTDEAIARPLRDWACYARDVAARLDVLPDATARDIALSG